MSKRRWMVRVAQEFEVETETADEAIAFLKAARDREIDGAVLVEGRGVFCELEDNDKETT